MARMSEKPAPVEEAPVPVKDAPDPLDGPDNEWVRVADPATGDHYSTTRALARIAGARLIPGHDALSSHGAPLPRKRNINKEN